MPAIPNAPVLATLRDRFQQRYGRPPEIVAYAPGRVEVLGNHTDYNEGFVLSAAIGQGTFFALAGSPGTACRLTAGDLMRTVAFDVHAPAPQREDRWANYCLGVLHGLAAIGPTPTGFDAMFLGNIPLGSGLSSSAALEMSAGLALARHYAIPVEPLALAVIGQTAEHRFAGVKCGLLDQISSLHGRAGMLVRTDFRTMEVSHVPLGAGGRFLLCDTHAKHALVDGEYNLRRADCEAAAAFFAQVLPHPVAALRDVSWTEWEAHQAALEPRVARRAAHPIGENARVLDGARLLAAGNLAGFGQLMFASHDSSIRYFDNSCVELDELVASARQTPGVLGARLSGGGFGGSAVMLLAAETDLEATAGALRAAYARRFGAPCETRPVTPGDGARLLPI